MSDAASVTAEVWKQSAIVERFLSFHAAIPLAGEQIGVLLTLLTSRPEPVKNFLDLGCGDSHVIAQSLGNDQEIVYCGVDSADMALEYAKAKLEKVRGEINLVHEDLMAALKGMKGSYDIIISGYSLHHLDTEKKKECFSLIAELLSDQGVFIFYDLEMKPDETAPQYIDRACQLMASEWTEFDEKTLEDIREHVEGNDLPENESFYLESFDRFGMSEVEKVFRDKDELFAAYLARRAA